MQSSTAIAFRALVMLVCLIGVPLAAIFNAPIREYAQKWLDSHKPGGSAQPTPLASATPTSTAAGSNQFSSPAAPWNGPTATTASPATPLAPPVAQPATVPATLPASAASQAGYELPANAPRTVQPVDFLAPVAPVATANGPPADPTLPKAMPAAQTSNPAASPAAPPTNSADAVKQIEHRFQELGATYYRLETWGSHGDQYRFYCLMALAKDPNQNQIFQASDAEPLRAMENVLHDVENWRRQRSTQ